MLQYTQFQSNLLYLVSQQGSDQCYSQLLAFEPFCFRVLNISLWVNLSNEGFCTRWLKEAETASFVSFAIRGMLMLLQ